MAKANRLALSVLVVLSFAAFAAAQSYTLTDLGPGEAVAINRLGVVAVNNPSYVRIPPNIRIALAGVDGGNLAVPSGINGQGLVAGYTGYATLWTKGTPLSLGTLPGGSFSYAYAINASGQVVGQSNGDGNINAQVFLWTQATGMQGLGYLPGGGFSGASAINRSGEIVGFSDAADGIYHGFAWSKTTGMQQLASLACGAGGSAYAINDLGQIAGQSACGVGEHAVLWSNSQSSALDLGTLPGLQYSIAYALNNLGQVVGSSGNSRTHHPFLWTAAKGMQDLNNLIPAGSGWVLQAANGINDKGWIVGSGTLNGQTEAFLLTPQ